MRSLTANTTDKKNTALGTTPIIILKVECGIELKNRDKKNKLCRDCFESKSKKINRRNERKNKLKEKGLWLLH